MKVIVTGGAGFIGSHLLKELIKLGHNIIVIDNFSTGKKDNIPQGCETIEYTLGSFELIPIPDADAIIHLAALPRVGRSIENPVETHKANVDSTLEVLEMARIQGIKRVIYASSSSVYGEHPIEDLPLGESSDKNPENPYAAQKLIGEELCNVYRKVYGLQTMRLRFFNVYGTNMATEGAYKLVFGNWVEQIKAGKRLTIYGDGEQTRDFTHVSDIVFGITQALSVDYEYIYADAFNLCTGVETSVNKLAQMFNWGVEHIDNPRDKEEKRKSGDNYFAKDFLDWKPTTSLEEGIKELREYYGI